MLGIPNPWMIVGALALLGGAWYHGYQTGVKHATARHNEQILKAYEEGERLKTERRDLEAQINDLSFQLELEANEDPIVVTQCLGPSRVRRLQSIRQE